MLYAVILIYNVFLIVGFWVLKKEFFLIVEVVLLIVSGDGDGDGDGGKKAKRNCSILCCYAFFFWFGFQCSLVCFFCIVTMLGVPKSCLNHATIMRHFDKYHTSCYIWIYRILSWHHDDVQY